MKNQPQPPTTRLAGAGTAPPVGARAKPERVMRTVSVSRVEPLTRDLVRVHFSGDAVRGIGPLVHTDSYIKLLFAPPGAGYEWPFDPEAIRES